jgi:SAM-dependent methyltransferase
MFKKLLKTWRELQAFEIDSYRESYKKRGDYYGYFSIDSRTDARKVGEIISQHCDICLDVGSGILPRPVYMNMNVKFTGVDPFFGEYPRTYPFAQAIGEHLPFKNNSFPCISFLSSLDHLIYPVWSLEEAYRVLKPGGLVFIWQTIWREDSRAYKKWKNAPPGTRFNVHHQHAFTEWDINNLLSRNRFINIQHLHYRRRRKQHPIDLFIGEKITAGNQL